MSKQVQPHILTQYTLLKEMGSGAYGHVWQVQQTRTHKRFALKKVFDAFRNSIDAQRTYRQVSILRQLNQDNIVRLYRVMKSRNKKDLYLVFQFMEADLHSVVGSDVLEKLHQVYVFYQVLKALKYLHSAELIHRDLKPSNVLLNSECKVKICDFGLVRTLNAERDEEAILSQEVATKWYRAPELLLGSRSYKKPIDVWSFGCIVAEILIGKPMFAGDSTLNQLERIMQFTGDIGREDIEALDSPVAQQLITQIKVKKRSFRQYFSSVDPDFWVLLKGTLEFNPNKRMTIDEVLQLELFDQFRQQIKQLKVSIRPIRPQIDDNVRFGMKVYRDKIYEDIDKSQNPQNGSTKKLTEIQNLIRPIQSGSKKRVSSQQKSKESSTKYKQRQYSVGSNTNSKSTSTKYRKKFFTTQKPFKPQSNPKFFNSTKPTTSLLQKKKPTSPYKTFFHQKPQPLPHNSHSQILSNYYNKHMIPPTANSIKIKKVAQTFVGGGKVSNQQNRQGKVDAVLQSGKVLGGGKGLRKVGSRQEGGRKFWSNGSGNGKDNILAKIGFA